MSGNQPIQLQTAIARVIAGALRVLSVPPPQRLSQWAEQNFYLSAESSYVEQHWRAWPFQTGMLDVIGHDQVHHVTIRKSARVGYTKMLLAYVGYLAEHKRRNAVIYQPTDDDRDEFVTTELDPMLRDVRAMRRVMPKFTKRSKDNTLRQKKFLTGLLHLRGGKAAKNYRRLTVDAVIYDEFSGFDRDIEKEGAPGKLGDKRLEGATFPKSLAGSTPKTKYNDNTEDRETEASMHLRWHVPCRHCDELHQITFGGRDDPHGLKWTPGDTAGVRHACPHCGGLITQSEYLEMWHGGVWIDNGTGAWLDQFGDFRVPAAIDWRTCEMREHRDPATILPTPGHVAMHIWTACAPQATWQTIVDEFLAAKRLAARGDFSLLKTFINTTLGETWEEKGEAADEHALQARAEDYPLGTVPAGGLVLTAGVDVQGNRFEIGVWAWGRGLESWQVDHHIIEGNPQSEEDWEQVAAHLGRRYTQAWHGGSLGLASVSVDANYQTQAVLNFVRVMQRSMRIHAIRGENDAKKPIKCVGTPQDVTWKGEKWRAGVRLWGVGVKSAKDMLHGQLQIGAPGPGYVHTSRHSSREWFEQLTAEQRILKVAKGGTEECWIKRRPRNEVLDCRNYALHAAYMLGLQSYDDARWLQLELSVQPEATPRQPTPAPVHRAPPPPAPAMSQRPSNPRPMGRDW